MTSFKRILLADNCPDFFFEELRSLGFEWDYQEEISNEEVRLLKDEYDAILIKSALVLDREFFQHFKKIQLVLRPGSGLDNVDIPYCENHNIRVINSPNGNSNAVGEHTVGLLLMMVNHLDRAIREVKEGNWVREANRGLEIEQLSIGVIGVGNAGSAFCQKLSGFGSKLLPHDKYKPRIESIGMDSYDLEHLYKNADVVSLHLPLNEETRFYADDAFFNSFEKPIYFINCSRGKVLDTSALLRAIESGKVVQAALDVLEVEPLVQASEDYKKLVSGLLATNKVLITPHIAGWTVEAKNKMFQILLDKYIVRV